MSIEMLSPEDIIRALRSDVPLYAPRAGGKRLTLSIINQMAHLIKLEEDYNNQKAILDRYRDNPFECVRDYCEQQQECRGCPRFLECESILHLEVMQDDSKASDSNTS